MADGNGSAERVVGGVDKVASFPTAKFTDAKKREADCKALLVEAQAKLAAAEKDFLQAPQPVPDAKLLDQQREAGSLREVARRNLTAVQSEFDEAMKVFEEAKALLDEATVRRDAAVAEMTEVERVMMAIWLDIERSRSDAEFERRRRALIVAAAKVDVVKFEKMIIESGQAAIRARKDILDGLDEKDVEALSMEELACLQQTLGLDELPLALCEGREMKGLVDAVTPTPPSVGLSASVASSAVQQAPVENSVPPASVSAQPVEVRQEEVASAPAETVSSPEAVVAQEEVLDLTDIEDEEEFVS